MKEQNKFFDDEKPFGAYSEGVEAYYAGKEGDENPYPITDPDHDKWADGYLAADTYEAGA